VGLSLYIIITYIIIFLTIFASSCSQRKTRSEIQIAQRKERLITAIEKAFDDPGFYLKWEDRSRKIEKEKKNN